MRTYRVLWMDRNGTFRTATDVGTYADRRLALIRREGGTVLNRRPL